MMCACKIYSLHEGPYTFHTFSVTPEVRLFTLATMSIIRYCVVRLHTVYSQLLRFLKFATTSCLATSGLGLLQLCEAMLIAQLGVEMVMVNTEQKKFTFCNQTFSYSVQHTQLSPPHNKLQSEFSEM